MSEAKIPSGVAMMLKALGVDPQEILSTIEKMGAVVVHIGETQKAILARQDEILQRLERLSNEPRRNPDEQSTDAINRSGEGSGRPEQSEQASGWIER